MSRIVLVSAGVCGALVWFLRRYIAGGVCRNTVSLKGKTAIVTGGNTGIGKATALGLAQKGARVILACRSLERGDRAAKEIRSQVQNADVAVRFLDLSSLRSIRGFVDSFTRTEDKLHILVNNAGVFGCPHTKTEDGFEMQFGVNHLGHFLLTNLLLDLLVKSAPSRIIIVSSALHKYATIKFDDLQGELSYNPRKAYGQSKLANLLFAHELNKRLPADVTVNSIHPGLVWTELGRHQSLSHVVKSIIYPLLLLILKTPWQGAQTTLYCATDEALQGVSGQYFGDCKQDVSQPHARDDGMAKKLWEISAELTGYKD